MSFNTILFETSLQVLFLQFTQKSYSQLSKYLVDFSLFLFIYEIQYESRHCAMWLYQVVTKYWIIQTLLFCLPNWHFTVCIGARRKEMFKWQAKSMYLDSFGVKLWKIKHSLLTKDFYRIKYQNFTLGQLKSPSNCPRS